MRVKRSLGPAVQARARYRQFRETVLTFVVYNVKGSFKQWISLPYGDSTEHIPPTLVSRLLAPYVRSPEHVQRYGTVV